LIGQQEGHRSVTSHASTIPRCYFWEHAQPRVTPEKYTRVKQKAKVVVLPFVQNWKRVFFMISIILCGVGFGGIKANISPLGAQQVS